MNVNTENYFDSFDFENATPIKHPLIAAMQTKQREQDVLALLDNDVKETLAKHNNAHDRQRINTVLRALFA